MLLRLIAMTPSSFSWRCVGLVFAVSAFPFACAAPTAMQSGPGVPASQGTVNVTEADNGNTNVDVRVKHLAPAHKMASDSTVYVVWLHAPQGGTQNLGALTLNDNLEGRLEALTPHRRFVLTVTPEPSAQATMPTHAPVFTTNIER